MDDDKESMWMLPGYFEGIKQVGGIPIIFLSRLMIRRSINSAECVTESFSQAGMMSLLPCTARKS